ncbi:MAG TPA: TraB/GumN family protein [Kiritimatiellia bacterium]|nr:TraB/GumN family protein [Kiritimatiellia bacterium]HMP33784.1 TraB/GumN family protein [Kiritimatiellia bacterium]
MKRLAVLLLTLAPMLAPAQGFLMWQAQKDDRVIHLLAAIPFLSANVATDLGPDVIAAYNESKLVAFEAEPDPERRKEGHRLIIQAGRYPEDDTLLNHLTPALRKTYQRLATEWALNTDNLNRLKPWMAAQTLLRIAMTQSKVRLGDDLEKLLYVRAKIDDRPMAFLNTAQRTVDLYTSLDDALHLRIFEKALGDARTLTNLLPAVETAWRAGDADTATSLVRGSFAGFEDVYRALFPGRNAAWAEDLDAHSVIEGDILAIIGLSHLVGEDSVLDALAARGYRIAQVVAP